MPSDAILSAVDNLFSDTMLPYPHTKMSPRERDAYFDDWMQVCKQMGVTKFTDAVNRARLQCRFFPQAADLLEYAPAPELGRPCSHPDTCACGGTGFVRVPPKPPQREARYAKCKRGA